MAQKPIQCLTIVSNNSFVLEWVHLGAEFFGWVRIEDRRVQHGAFIFLFTIQQWLPLISSIYSMIITINPKMRLLSVA